MMYVVYVLNHIALASLNWQNPIFKAFGITKDITPLCLFTWWELVYYYNPDIPFPKSREKIGRFAGFVDDVGDAFCFKMVTADTEEVLYRSVLRSALDDGNQNLCPSSYPTSDNSDDDEAYPTPRSNGENADLSQLLNASQTETQPLPFSLMRDAAEIPLLLTLADDDKDPLIPSTRTHFMNPDELIGKTFLREREDDGTIHRAKIMQRIENADNISDQYLVKVGKDREEVMNYNSIIDLLNKQIYRKESNPDNAYSFKSIKDHKKTGSSYEVLVEWDGGEMTWEPIALMRHDDPVTLANYGKENNLLNEPGWKCLKHYVKSSKRLEHNI